MPQASILRLAGRRRRFLAEWAIVAAASVALLAALIFTHATARLDNLAYDQFANLTPAKASRDIVIVAIDNESLTALGPWPWPRQRHADLLNQLAQASIHGVAYDVLFLEPATDPAQDAALAQAMIPTPTWLPVLLEAPGRDGRAVDVGLPAAPIARAAAGLGHVNLDFDTDGIVRRAFLRETADGQVFEQLVANLAPGRLTDVLHEADTTMSATPTSRGLTRSHEVMIPFAPAGAFVTAPFAAILRGEVPKEVLRGKTVLVGATASGLHDHYETPARDPGGLSGVEVQANLLNALLQGSLRKPASDLAIFAANLAALGVVLAGFLVLSPRRAVILLGCAALALVLLADGLLLGAHLWLSPVAGLVMLALVYPLWSWRRLEATSGYMLRELEQFRTDDAVWRRAQAVEPHGDLVARQLDLMDRAVTSLRGLRRFVSDALHGLPDPTLVLDAEGRVLLANGRAETVFDAPVDKTWSTLGTDWSRLEGASPALPEDGQEADLISADGRIWRVRAVGATGEDGAYLIVRFTDVSEAHAAAENRARLMAFLTHDMRSPQASILALISGAEASELKPAMAAQIRAYAGRTLGLADDFVHLARAQSDAYDLQLTDLSDVLIEAQDELWPQARAKAMTLALNGEETEHLVMGDRALLTRVAVNLIDNALKYSSAGAVTCTLVSTPSEIIMTIADQGQGMTPEEAARAFEPFERIRAADQPRIRGAGLGLAFVRVVVQRHSGRITCDSQLGQGTTISLVFPKAG